MSVLTARLLVFFTSAAVLVIEILAQRLLAPYLGVSLEVFTGVIGVILAGIALGAWLGGRAADQGDPARLLGPLLVAGGVSALGAPLLVDLLGPVVTGGGPGSIVLITTIGFLAPAGVLSAVPPVVVKLRLASLDHTGSVVGSLSAVGTAGAIFGTFLTGFVLIAAFPTRPIVLTVGLALILTGISLGGLRSRWAGPLSLVGPLLLVGLVALEGPCDYETTYHCAQVVADPARSSGRTLVLDGVPNSYIDLDDPTHLEFRYTQVMADVIEVALEPGPIDVLSIGGGGFTFPAYIDAVRPGSRHVVLEIDPLLVTIGRTELGLGEEATVIVADARKSLGDVAGDPYDLVIGDAFSGLSVPWHLTTVEFVSDVADRMRVGGVYVINVIDYGDLDFARAETATFASVFPHVAVLAPPSYLRGEDGGNFVIAGSFRPLDIAAVEARITARRGTEEVLTEVEDFIDGAGPLTDDFAPVDQMIDRPR